MRRSRRLAAGAKVHLLVDVADGGPNHPTAREDTKFGTGLRKGAQGRGHMLEVRDVVQLAVLNDGDLEAVKDGLEGARQLLLGGFGVGLQQDFMGRLRGVQRTE